MAALFGIGLVTFEIVDAGCNRVAGLFARADRIDLMAHGQQGLKRHHGFIVFGEIAGDHQDLLSHSCSVLQLGNSRWRKASRQSNRVGIRPVLQVGNFD